LMVLAEFSGNMLSIWFVRLMFIPGTCCSYQACSDSPFWWRA
jgi:hypothetical protein